MGENFDCLFEIFQGHQQLHGIGVKLFRHLEMQHWRQGEQKEEKFYNDFIWGA